VVSRKERKDSKLAHTSTSIFRVIKFFLENVGKPFYKIISSLVIIFLFVFHQISRLKKPSLPKIKLKPVFVRINLRKIKTSVKLKLLKIKLAFLKISKPKRIVTFKPKLIITLLVIIFIVFEIWVLIFKNLPSPTDLTNREQEVSTKILDRNGVLLYKIFKDENRTIIPLDKIPKHVQLATLAAEDAEFYTHPGFSIKGIFRAFVNNVKKDEMSGGSTITQQLVKNALLSSEKTLIRKLRELILAIAVETIYTKDEILQMYLNEVSYGGTAYGIQEASKLYFNKNAQNLTLSEATFLAGLPKRPSQYSPFSSTPEDGMLRQKDVVNLMVINKYITRETAELILSEGLYFAPNKTSILAPHFVMYVRQYLEETYGTEMVEKGGLEVITSLDYEIQKKAEEIVESEVNTLKHLNVSNGAVLVLNPKNGEILAMVGSKDYFDTTSDGNVNVVTRPRQPGSSIKLINYAYALSNGYSPSSILDDSPITFRIPGSPSYSPKNYDNTYRGKLSIKSAFAESRNIPAVKLLANYGVEKMIEMGEKMGITTWEDKSRFGLSLTLGGGEVKLIDLASAYSTVANQGERININPILKTTNYKGKILEEKKCEDKCTGEKVLDKRVSFLLTDILSNNQARTPAFGGNSLLNIKNHPEVAVKTGTSNNLRDNLAVGFNQDYTVAAWVGNNDNTSMSRVASGVTGATPIFNKVMTYLLENKETASWEIPEGLIKQSVCIITGSLPCRGCPSKEEWFLEENVPTTHCNLENVIKIKEDSNKPKLLPEAAATNR